MKFWFSGELDERIDEAYRPVRVRVESLLNAHCGERQYGDAIVKIAIIPMILGPEHLEGMPERRLWQRKKQSADYRTIIDFEKFRDGDDTERLRLLVDNVIDAVGDLQKKAGKGFRGEELISDIREAFGM